MAEYYNDRSLLQGSNAPQMNVMDVAKAGSLVANALGSVREKELENTRLAREAERYKREGERYEREQVLNQRADQDWNRQQAVQQASKDIAKELIDTPYATKFGGAENTAQIDEAVLKETERRNQLGLAPFNAEEAAGIQRTYEANRPFKEDARNKIAAALMSKGASAAQANQEAEGLTTGMISRADKQAMANQMRDDQQKYYDKVADSKLELYKTLTSNDLERMKALGTSYGIGGGGSAKGGVGLSTSWDEVMSKDYNLSPWGTGAFGDDARVKELAIAARSDKVSPWAFQKALENSLIRSPGGDTIDEKVLKDNINTYSSVEQKLRAAQTGDSAKTAGISVESLLNRPYVPQTVVGYDPKSMMDVLAKNAPTVVGSRDEVLQGGGSTATGTGKTLADRNYNPGNIKFDKNTQWEGGKEGEKGFVKFDTPELGARALAKVITNNVGTPVNAFITKYAPPYENDTTSYIANAVKAIGKKPTDTIEEKDVLPLMKIIAKVEGGTFTADQLKTGYDMINKKSSGSGIVKTDKALVDIFGKSSADGLVEAISNAPTKKEQLDLIRSNYNSDASTQELESILQKVKATPKVNGEKQAVSLATFSATRLTPEDVKERELIFDTKGAAAANEFVKSRYDLGKDYANMYKAGFSSDEMKHYGALKREGHIKEANNYYSAIYEKRNQLDGYTSSSPITIKDLLPDWKTDNTAVSDQDVQKQRAAVIAKRYQLNPGLLSPEELRWIQDSKMTVNGRKQLSELGIK